MPRDASKAAPKTDLDRLNALIDWYERNKPDAGKRIQTTLPPDRLAKMLGIGQQPDPGRPGAFLPFPPTQPYRGRVILSANAK